MRIGVDIIKKTLLLIVSLFTFFTLASKITAKDYSNYKIGDKISIGSLQYIVIEDSDASKDNILVIRSTPLSKTEIGGIETYVSTDDSDKIPFYSSDTCNSLMNSSDCDSHYSYETSTVKQVLDNWANQLDEKLSDALIPVNESYDDSDIVRLLNHTDIDRIKDNKSLDTDESVITEILGDDSAKPIWFTPDSSESSNCFNGTEFAKTSVYNTAYVFPVIRVHKGALDSDSNTATSGVIIDENNDNTVGVDNTLFNKSFITLIIGLVLVSIGTGIYIAHIKKK